jgi:hypothetical protein
MSQPDPHFAEIPANPLPGSVDLCLEMRAGLVKINDISQTQRARIENRLRTNYDNPFVMYISPVFPSKI